MNCVSELELCRYVDGELDAAATARVEGHLADCATCPSLAESLRLENSILVATIRNAEGEEFVDSSAVAQSHPLTWRELAGTAAWVAFGAFGLEYARQSLPSSLPGADWMIPVSTNGLWTSAVNAILYVSGEGARVIATGTVVLSGALALGFALWLAHSLLRHRLGSVAVLGSLMLLVLGAAPAAQAKTVKQDETFILAAGEKLEETLIAMGTGVIIDGELDGNLFAFAGQVRINGTVTGDVFVMAENLSIRGTVGSNVFSWSQYISISGNVGGSVHVFTQDFRLEESGRISGDVATWTNRGDIEGAVDRSAYFGGAMLNVRGTVGRDIKARGGRITLFPSAVVNGDVEAWVKKESSVHIDPGAVIGGETLTHLLRERGSRYARFSFYRNQFLFLGAAFLLGLLMLWLFPALLAAESVTALDMAKMTGLGFVIFLVTLVGSVVTALTLVGIPTALLALEALLAGVYLAKIAVAVLIGRLLMGPATTKFSRTALSLLAGLTLIFVAVNIPYAGSWINTLVSLFGLGMLSRRAYRMWKASRTAVTSAAAL